MAAQETGCSKLLGGRSNSRNNSRNNPGTASPTGHQPIPAPHHWVEHRRRTTRTRAGQHRDTTGTPAPLGHHRDTGTPPGRYWDTSEHHCNATGTPLRHHRDTTGTRLHHTTATPLEHHRHTTGTRPGHHSDTGTPPEHRWTPEQRWTPPGHQ